MAYGLCQKFGIHNFRVIKPITCVAVTSRTELLTRNLYFCYNFQGNNLRFLIDLKMRDLKKTRLRVQRGYSDVDLQKLNKLKSKIFQLLGKNYNSKTRI